MTMQSVSLAATLVESMAEGIGAYDFSKSLFKVHSGVSDRPRGKIKDVSWRKSSGYRSRKARANNRKAMRSKSCG